jgi:hypothetical protein
MTSRGAIAGCIDFSIFVRTLWGFPFRDMFNLQILQERHSYSAGLQNFYHPPRLSGPSGLSGSNCFFSRGVRLLDVGWLNDGRSDRPRETAKMVPPMSALDRLYGV